MCPFGHGLIHTSRHAGGIGREFADALAERARAGVKVHVVLDWLGSKKMEERYVREMEAAGVEVMRYHPLNWFNAWRDNHRTHRKLLVVDGAVGFTGGVGIADEWNGHAQDKDHWRDTHYRIEGPAVAQMQAAFMDNWMKTHDRVLHGDEYFPPLQPAAYLSFAIAGTLAAIGGWVLVVRLVRRSARLLRVLVPVLVVLSLIPDAVLLATGFIPGATPGAVIALALMHPLVAAVAVVAGSRIAPAR